MVERPPQPEHFASAPPRPDRPRRYNVFAGVGATLVVAGALAGAFAANRQAARAAQHTQKEQEARHSADLARQGQLSRAAAQVAVLRKRMHTLAVEAGVAAPSASSHAVDAGASR